MNETIIHVPGRFNPIEYGTPLANASDIQNTSNNKSVQETLDEENNRITLQDNKIDTLTTVGEFVEHSQGYLVKTYNIGDIFYKIESIENNQVKHYYVARVNGFAGDQITDTEKFIDAGTSSVNALNIKTTIIKGALQGDDAYGVYVKQWREEHPNLEPTTENGFLEQDEWLESLIGDSAYEVAKSNGFSGSESDWLEYIRGKSAREIYNARYNKNLNDAEFVAELKINYTMLHVGYDSTNAGTTIGVPFTGNLDPTGDNIAAGETTIGKLYLMPDDDSDPENCIGFVTVLDGSTYKWCNVGAIKIPSDVLAKSDVDNECTDGTIDTPASANVVMDLKAKMEGVTASEEKVQLVTSGEGQNVFAGRVIGATGNIDHSGSNDTNYKYVELEIPSNVKSIRFMTPDSIGWNAGWAIGHYSDGDFVKDRSSAYVFGREFTVEVKEGETHFRTNCYMIYSTPTDRLLGFYCYLQSGKNVMDNINSINSDISKLELFRQDYEQYEEVDMNKDSYKISNYHVKYNGTFEQNNGWSYIEIPVTGYSKVHFLALIRNEEQPQGYCFKDENGNFFGGKKYKYTSTSGTEEITLDIPDNAVWFYTNSRFSFNTYFTNNFFIKLIKGDTLKTIIDNAKQDCNSYTDTKVSDVEEEIDDINSLLTYSEGIEDKIEYARGGYTTASKPTAYKGTEAANKRKLRIWNASNKSYYTYMPTGSSITAPEDCAKTYYRIYDTNKNLTSGFQSLSSGTVKTFSEDCYIVVYLYNEGGAYLWDTESNYSSGAITQLGTTVMQEYISGIVFDEKNINDRFDEFDERLQKVENGVTDKGLITMQLPSTAVEYHEQYDEMVEAGFLERHSATELDESLLVEIPDALVDNPDYLQDKFPLYYYELKKPVGYCGLPGNGYFYTSDKIRASRYNENELGRKLLNKKRTKILLISGQHGNEKAEPQALFEFVKRLCTNAEYSDILINCEFVIVPLLNPFGYNWDYRFTGKGYVGQIGGSPLTYHGWNINADFTDVQYYWYNSSSSSTFPKNRLYGFGTVGAKLIRKILEIEGNTGDGRFDLMIDLHQHDEDVYDNDNLRCLGGMTSVNYGNLTEEQKERFLYLITEAGIKTDISSCISTGKDYTPTNQTCFAWATGLSIGATSTTKGYIAGQNGLSTLYGTHYDGLPESGQYVLGNTRHRGSSAKVTMTLETSTRCNYYNDAISDAAGKYNNIALAFANTYTDNILKLVIREMMSGSMNRDMSDYYDTPNHDWRYDDDTTQHPDE